MSGEGRQESGFSQAPKSEGVAGPVVESSFEKIHSLPDEARGTFFNVFSQWLTNSPEFSESKQAAPDDVKHVMQQVMTDEDGQPRPREDVIKDYQKFIDVSAKKATKTVGETLQQIRGDTRL